MSESFNQSVIDEFRANGGKVGGPFEGGDLLLLTTVGAKSGKEHTVPLAYVRDGDLLLVVASAAGAPRHPAWYHNLLARPAVRVELGEEVFDAVAVPAEGAARERLFEHVVRVAPGYGDYQARTARTLPVVLLERPEVPAEVPEDVTTMAGKLLEIHAWLRAQLGHVREEAGAHFAERAHHEETRGAGEAGTARPGGAERGDLRLGLRLRQHCLAFCQGLELHHRGEDAAVFPALADMHPHLRDALDRLGEQHRVIARVQGELVALLDGIGTAEPRRFMAELDRMSEELRAHLDDEEEWLLPVLAQIPFPPVPGPPPSDQPGK
ncbi:nitroreductase family deazaflavin-dependent oxidoreductase [Microbispora cellulosiformans]|uniref:Nitroreductase family deazaflavin-dependent oxidoreductase n=1 Tax=Microbispora cellulosiformans TaxID=2614688 RepID=A0A5J5KA93_9ACTN|nr:nitroreductase/quinone reductase family protein [Microbispora cellulosiformans]KAA9381900.1 nitroreductase family deazaflavin-dependent oxidoreductase [Microbispora cellulosiformans]